MNNAATTIENDKQSLAIWIARLIFILFLLSLVFMGAGAAFLALSDTDTCWLLSLGKWIMENKRLPLIDPFSSGVGNYATIIPGQPLAQYQWLAEIIFYCSYKLASLNGLIILVSLMSCITFVCLPYLYFYKARLPISASFFLIFIGEMLASLRWSARPHIFSFLFLALLIYLLIPSQRAMKNLSKKDLTWVFLIMVAWTNIHIYFPLGIIFVWLVYLIGSLQRFILKNSLPSLSWHWHLLL